ncbi:MAG: undecaprenyl-diphosphate phosphatase [Candidatus Kaiserbacteria bacterium]|nr:undecaprenyl-diphosphate phosphatase [Candidatus Kaiserbacteria bacterium]
MNIIHAIILGVIEGFTEFLPISSTGHQILVSHLLQIPQTDFLKSFEIVIQLGAILAVVVLYWRRFLDIEILKKLFVAFLPTGIIGLALYKIVKIYLIGNETVVLWALLIGGIVLIAFEYLHTEGDQESLSSITYKQAALIGLFQAIAIIPGVSRSAATIVGGMLLGLKRATIVEFSFLLAVPTMAAASALDILKSFGTIESGGIGVLLVGFVVSFVVAILGIRFLLAAIRRYSFVPFGIYRILLAAAVFIFTA